MKKGDWGILQQLLPDLAYLNETPAEIVDELERGNLVRKKDFSIHLLDIGGFLVATIDSKINFVAIEKHQIRPIEDPDAAVFGGTADVWGTTKRKMYES